MNIDHICFAVKDINEGIDYWRRVFGYIQMTKVVENPVQKVKVTFLKKDNGILIKLIEPLKNNQSINNFVSRGGGFHHLCFKCADIDQKFDELTEKGLIPLSRPQEGEAFNNKKIAFLLARYNLNVELIDTDEKAGIL